MFTDASATTSFSGRALALEFYVWQLLYCCTTSGVLVTGHCHTTVEGAMATGLMSLMHAGQRTTTNLLNKQ
jgi:hypothetical protein